MPKLSLLKGPYALPSGNLLKVVPNKYVIQATDRLGIIKGQKHYIKEILSGHQYTVNVKSYIGRQIPKWIYVY